MHAAGVNARRFLRARCDRNGEGRDSVADFTGGEGRPSRSLEHHRCAPRQVSPGKPSEVANAAVDDPAPVAGEDV